MFKQSLIYISFAIINLGQLAMAQAPNLGQDEFICDAAAGCSFVLHPGTGRHIQLNNIAQKFFYNCTINGLGAAGELNQAEAKKIGITDTNFNHRDAEEYLLNFSTYNMTVTNGALHFNMTNFSDEPYSENITCKFN
jgi:hypothetical protein